MGPEGTFGHGLDLPFSPIQVLDEFLQAPRHQAFNIIAGAPGIIERHTLEHHFELIFITFHTPHIAVTNIYHFIYLYSS